MNAFDIKIAAVVCSLAGTLLLAVRVKRILTALSLVARVHEENFKQRWETNQIAFTGATKHLKRAEDTGVTILVVGFGLLVLAALLNGYALYLEKSAQPSPNKVTGANCRPASPLEAGRQFGCTSCAPPSLSAAVAQFGRSATSPHHTQHDTKGNA